MAKLFFKLFPVLIFWGVFIFVIFQIPYPENLPQANITTVIAFFIPFFIALTLTIDLFFKNTFLSASISLGLVALLILKALDSLNLVTGILITIVVVLLISYFRKGSNLTKTSRIPKLTQLRKQ